MILINSSPQDSLKIFQPFPPVFLPVGAGFILAACEEVSIKTHFIDEQIDDNPLQMVADMVKEMEPPYIFGFSILTKGFKTAISLSEQLKKLYPDSVVVFLNNLPPLKVDKHKIGVRECFFQDADLPFFYTIIKRLAMPDDEHWLKTSYESWIAWEKFTLCDHDFGLKNYLRKFLIQPSKSK